MNQISVHSKYSSNFSIFSPAFFAVLIGFIFARIGLEQKQVYTISITVLCAIYWVTEAIPIPATSLIPLAIFPLLGILDGKQLAGAYSHSLILLLLGGFILSKAVEKSGLHKRFAIKMISLFGKNSSKGILTGFMISSAILSMWISNTATTLMLLPIALAVLNQCENKELDTPLLLGIAYAASLGGLGTPIGSPPNLIFMKVFEEYTGLALSFAKWCTWGIPTVLIFLPIMIIWLSRNLKGKQKFTLPHLGPWNKAQKRVLIIFFLTATAWVFRKEPFGGWSTFLDIPNANDASVAMCGVLALFMCSDGKNSKLLDWKTANTIPWGILLLFGAGIALAKAFVSTGLSESIAQYFSGLLIFEIIYIIFIVGFFITFLTEFTSNTATANLMMPILASAAAALNISPSLLMVPAAMSASCAFMLPVATAPNSIVFSTEKVPIKSMLREGFALNIIGIFIISLVTYLILGSG